MWWLLITVAIGTIQFGYMIGSWNVVAQAYGKKEGWDEDELTDKMVIVMTITVLGAAIGSLFSGYLAFIGRWTCLLIANGVIIIAAGITLVPNFAALCIGRFIYGLGVGGFSVFVPKYIAETAPTEIKGPAGALTQITVTLGILIAFSVGLGIHDVEEADIDSFEIQHYWQVVFVIPIGIAIIHIILLLTVFPYETPVVLKENEDFEKLNDLMIRIYQDEGEADARINEIYIAPK